MAFLRGTLTYKQLRDDGELFRLLAGERSDDFGNTAPAGEAWERVTATRLVSPGTSVNSPTNINAINMYLDWHAETDPQESLSFSIQCKRPIDGTNSVSSDQMRIQVFTNGSLVNDTDLLAYWISITKDRIIMAIQGDTAHTGNMNLIYIGTYTRLYNSTQDPYPVIVITSHVHTGEYPFNVHSRLQLCRTDKLQWLDDRNQNEVDIITANRIIDSNPNVWDNKWYFYTLYIVGNDTGGDSTRLGYRGKLLDLYTLDNNSWSNRDILTDGSTSWRLIFPFQSNSTATSQAPQNLGNTGYVYFAFKQS
jgi:hypothetical protein